MRLASGDVRQMYASCCTSIHQCRLAAEAGFDRVALSAGEVAAASPETLKTLERQLRDWSVECRGMNDFCPSELKLCGPDYIPERVSGYVSRLAPRAAELGVTQIGVGAPLSRMLPEGYPRDLAWRQLRESMSLTARLCRPYGIRILLEPVCRQMTNFLNYTAEVFSLVETCAVDDLGMVYDIYHAWMMGESPAALLPAMGRIGIVHIAHARHGRRLPQADTIGLYQPYFQTLLEAGYQGEVALEAQLDRVTLSQLTESRQALEQMLSPGRQSAAG